MANDSGITQSNTVFSPAAGLTDGFDVGTASTPPAPSVHPNFDLTEKGEGGMAPQTAAMESIGGVGASAGAVPFAQFYTGEPQTYEPGDDPMVGGIGTPPKS